MKLPENLVLEIAREKILNYLLDPNHPDGKPKAEFLLANGITTQNYEMLEKLLREQAMNEEITKELNTAFGKKFIFESPLKFPNGKTHRIRSIWVLSRNQNILKFVTAYKVS